MNDAQSVADALRRGLLDVVVTIFFILGIGIVASLAKDWLKKQCGMLAAAWMRTCLIGKILLPSLVVVDIKFRVRTY